MRALAFVVLAVFVGLGAAQALGADDARPPSFKSDDPDYTTAATAIKAGDFPAAIRLLEGVVTREPANADAFNLLGYATRLNGDPARSIPIYEKALALDPKHRGAHEYIGEAYLALNDLPKAKEHLARLDALCFFPCAEYRDLKKAIQTYEAGRGRSVPAGR